MKKLSKQCLKFARSNSNQKELTFGSLHAIKLPPSEDVEAVLGDGANKEQRKLKFQKIFQDYALNVSFRTHQLMEARMEELIKAKEEVARVEQKVTSAKDETLKAEQRVTSAKDETLKAEQRVTSAKDETLKAVTSAKDEVIKAEQRFSKLTEKWKETEKELQSINEKHLRLTNNFNVRGAIEFVRAEILGKSGPSVSSKFLKERENGKNLGMVFCLLY